MKKEDIVKYCNSKNWNMNQEEYDLVGELSGEVSYSGLGWNYLVKECDFMDDKLKDLFDSVGEEEVRKEVFVRGILDGWVEEEIFRD